MADDHPQSPAPTTTPPEIPTWLRVLLEEQNRAMAHDRALLASQQREIAAHLSTLTHCLGSLPATPSLATIGLPARKRRWGCGDCLGLGSICYGCIRLVSVLVLIGIVTFVFLFIIDQARHGINTFF